MRDGRRNQYVAEWCERAAAARYRLERVDENACDAYTTPETPVTLLDADVPVEVKGCRARIADGHGRSTTGRWTITLATHDTLVDRDGQYALPVYETLGDPGADGRILIRRCALVPAQTVDELIGDPHRPRVKLPWTAVYETLDEPDIHGT